MLSPILVRGKMFLSSIRALGVKCEEMGTIFKNPSNAFYSKAATMSARKRSIRNAWYEKS
jgi:hypothetical protein